MGHHFYLLPLNLVGDYGGGGMLMALGTVAAQFETSRSGLGQVIDAAMVDGAAILMSAGENRAQYDRSKLRYPSDVTDAEWEHISVADSAGQARRAQAHRRCA